MDIKYIDAHCHLQFEQYDEDREEIIEQMCAEGIAGIVVGTDLELSKKAVALAEQHEHLFATVGLHPNHEEAFDACAFAELVKHPKVVGVGECGLDYFRPDTLDDETRNKQAMLFNMQIALAAEAHKPLVIHARPSKGTMDAYHDVIKLLRAAKAEYPDLRGDAHFFAGGAKEARAFVELGFTVSFTAVVTFARDYDEVIRSVPLENILAETDAPYVAPASRRGERNDPLAIPEIVTRIAITRGGEPEIVRAALLNNTKRLFGLAFPIDM